MTRKEYIRELHRAANKSRCQRWNNVRRKKALKAANKYYWENEAALKEHKREIDICLAEIAGPYAMFTMFMPD